MNWITKPHWWEDEWMHLTALRVHFCLAGLHGSFHICGWYTSIFNSLSYDVKGKVMGSLY